MKHPVGSAFSVGKHTYTVISYKSGIYLLRDENGNYTVDAEQAFDINPYVVICERVRYNLCG